MIKRLVSFLFFLAPAAALGVTCPGPDCYDPGAGNAAGGDGLLIGINAGNSVRIISGNGLVVQGGGITLAGNLYVGQNDTGAPTGQLYVETTTQTPFTIQSLGAINVAGNLDVRAGRNVGILTTGAPINAGFGAILNAGTLGISNIATLTTGSVTTSGNMSLAAAIMNLGAVANNGGVTSLTTTGAMTLGQFVSNSAGTSTITGASLNTGTIQNNVGTTNVNLTGNLVGTGNIFNSGTAMSIAANNVTVAGTMKNDSTAGTMTLNLASLTVNGGNLSNPSFVNSGNLFATITGATYLEYGFDLSTMNNTNTFSLETGTLAFGGSMAPSGYLQLFDNHLNSMTLKINNGAITANNIINNDGSNVNANMSLTATSINGAVVQNNGKILNMTATNSAGGIVLTGGVTSVLGSTTNMASAGNLNIAGVVNNVGAMVLNGVNVNLNSALNSGNLQILAPTSVGKINTTGGLTNTSGTMYVESREINIGGSLISNGGTTTIVASDSAGTAVQINSVTANAGVINIDAILGLGVVNGLTVASGGAMNFSNITNSLTTGTSINIAGNLTASATAATGFGNVNTAAVGPETFVMRSTGGAINIDGNVSAIANDFARTIRMDAQTTMKVIGNVTAANKGILIFGDPVIGTVPSGKYLDIDGIVASNAGGIINFSVADIDVGALSGAGKFIARGTTIEATNNGVDTINISNGIWFDGSDMSSGFVIRNTNDFTLLASGIGSDIRVAGGVTIGAANKLTLNAVDQINVAGATTVAATGQFKGIAGGAVTFGAITNHGTFNIDPTTITTADIINTGTMALTATGNVTTGNITNSGPLAITGAVIASNAVNSTANIIDLVGTSWAVSQMSITGGALNLNANSLTSTGNISTNGNLSQGANTGRINLIKSGTTTVAANNLTIGGNMSATQYTGIYNVTNTFGLTGNMNVLAPATVTVNAPTITADDVTNNGTLTLAGTSIDLGDVTNTATLNINSGATNNLLVDSFTTTNGGARLTGRGMTSAGDINIAGRLLQNFVGTLSGGDTNAASTNYTLTGPAVAASSISQTSGAMTINTSDLDIGGNINAANLRIASIGTNWLTADVLGNISGGVDIIGLQKMTVGGNYTFNDTSMLSAAILPRSGQSYWSTVNMANGQITNGSLAEPIISVAGKFITNLSSGNPNMYSGWNTGTVGALQNSQFGINIFDTLDAGTAIWLLHADDGVEEQGTKVRNAVVRFCNADASICYNYLDSLTNIGTTDPDDLPAYLSVRDTDGDGIGDSVYIVFDPRFGGPANIFKIQPIVNAEADHTTGEYYTAGALDDMIEGQLKNTGFFNNTPIELVPVIFQNTNLAEMSNELYNRMEQYLLDRDGTALSRFSRLFQPRELEQIAGTIALTEHTIFRDFEDRMFDDFIWNRHRKIKKAWFDADFGKFTQKDTDGVKGEGDRFSIMGGFDTHVSSTLILGLVGHVTNASSTQNDRIDIKYAGPAPIWANVDTDVSDLNIGIGGYLTKILSNEVRLYGNAFIDAHMIDVTREQNFVDGISGTGTAFSVTSEWGLMHDILNQYIVGNVYVRAGYNSGFSITENAAGSEYMKLESDGYFILTPGYSLTAQKRIYPSTWFQIRPNITIGAEYDVLGTPEFTQFKFAPANRMTDYKVDIDPMWAYAGLGVEFISVSGFQLGIDYRYQYNADIQMHKIKLSGIYRF